MYAGAKANTGITIGGGKYITEYIGDYKDGRDVKLALDHESSADAAAALDSESNIDVSIDGDKKGRDGFKSRFEGPKIKLGSDAKAGASLYGPGYGGYGYGSGYGYGHARADNDIVIDGVYFETIFDGEGKGRDAIKAALDHKSEAESEASVA